MSTAVIDGMGAGDEYGRGRHDRPEFRGFNQLETNARVWWPLVFAHGLLPVQAGALQGSQPPTPGTGPLQVMRHCTLPDIGAKGIRAPLNRSGPVSGRVKAAKYMDSQCFLRIDQADKKMKVVCMEQPSLAPEG